LRAAQGNAASTLITAPRLTLFNGQRAYVKVARNTAYVRDVKLKAGSKEDYEPIVGTIESGVLFDCQARVSDDRKFVTLTLRPKLTELMGMTPQPATTTAANRDIIQVPHVMTHDLDATITMPDQKTAVYRLGPSYSSTSRP